MRRRVYETGRRPVNQGGMYEARGLPRRWETAPRLARALRRGARLRPEPRSPGVRPPSRLLPLPDGEGARVRRRCPPPPPESMRDRPDRRERAGHARPRQGPGDPRG
jgi:hypothetical protein